jgi:hypothetical protein
MAEKLKIKICSEIPTLNEDNDQEEKYIPNIKKSLNATYGKVKNAIQIVLN